MDLIFLLIVIVILYHCIILLIYGIPISIHIDDKTVSNTWKSTYENKEVKCISFKSKCGYSNLIRFNLLSKYILIDSNGKVYLIWRYSKLHKEVDLLFKKYFKL